MTDFDLAVESDLVGLSLATVKTRFHSVSAIANAIGFLFLIIAGEKSRLNRNQKGFVKLREKRWLQHAKIIRGGRKERIRKTSNCKLLKRFLVEIFVEE